MTPPKTLPSTCTVIDGKLVAETLLASVKKDVERLREQVGLAVVLVGEDPASKVYVNKKMKTAAAVGFHSEKIILDAQSTETALLDVITQLNHNPTIHGILVQLPLPAHMNTQRIIEAIAPGKDVDGFHPINAGKLACGLTDGSVPCTPKGVMTMLAHYQIALAGQHAIVIGRSNIVGKPMAQLLLNANATVTICHSRTPDIPTITRTADIVVAAVGKPEWVQGNWLKPGAVVIDVGINRTPEGTLVGDVHFDSAAAVAGFITPVPGGVGPMTVATLMQNTLNAYRAFQR